MQKLLILLILLTINPSYAMQRLINLKKQNIYKPAHTRSLFTAPQRQKTKELLKTTLKNPIALTNAVVPLLSAYGVSKGIMGGSELFALGSGAQGLLSLANALKMYKAEVRKKLHQKNSDMQKYVEYLTPRYVGNGTEAAQKTLIHHLQTLQKQKESFGTCNESFNGLILANGFAAGTYFVAALFLNQYNLEIMFGSLGNVINAMKLNGEHQESIKIQNTTERYLAETEHAEEIIRKKLENEIKK